MSLFIIGATIPETRPYWRSPSKSGYYITGNGNRLASANCHPLLSHSNTMQINSLLNPLDSTIANLPQLKIYFILESP